MNTFLKLGLPQQLLQALEKMQFSKPTPVQAASIPQALEGRDILGTAQTGTGKTAAFGIPMLAKVMNDRNGMALVVAPTRELAAQIMRELEKMAQCAPQINMALLIGGAPISKQLRQLRRRPRIIIGTPGRINDHLRQRSLNLSPVDFVVLDETDRMLDMGFETQIDAIMQYVPKTRQTLLFSATLPPRIAKLASKYQNKPERVSIGAVHKPAAKISQELIQLQQGEKYATLVTQLRQRNGSVIVFVKTKRGADRIAKKLNAADFSARAIHGNLNQNQRTRAIQSFRDKQNRIMVATDIAARGLDIPHIEHVINYDLPQCPEDYIHRIGRTARAGAQGAAVCFITPDDREKWRSIHFLMNPDAKKEARKERPRTAGNGKKRPSPGNKNGRRRKSRKFRSSRAKQAAAG